ncbi:MAG: tetratricopeptide repeat protein [Myxococcales bacterium]|nr:tetratricopeptide repeat protein [Myxococcales bacterium]
MGDLLRFELGPRRGLRRGIGATAWYAEGCALEATDPSRARAAYERAIAGRPDLADAYNNLGRVMHDQPIAGRRRACSRRSRAATGSRCVWTRASACTGSTSASPSRIKAA